MTIKISQRCLLLLTLVFCFSCAPDQPKKTKKKAAPKKEAAAKTIKAEVASPTDPASAPIPKEQLKKAQEILDSVDKDVLASVDGKKKYKQFCTVCHGFKGDMKMNGAKDLRKLKTSMVERVAQIYFGKGLMTPFKGVLKDEEIVAVAEYISTLKNLK